jgi:hypothetical protein
MRPFRFKRSELILAVSGGPFRANTYKGISQGEPWAMLFWPLRATDGELRTMLSHRRNSESAAVALAEPVRDFQFAPGL